MAVGAAQGLALLVKDIGHALEKEHPEDIFLLLGRMHGAAQNVGGFHQEGFELGEGDLAGRQSRALLGGCAYALFRSLTEE